MNEENKVKLIKFKIELETLIHKHLEDVSLKEIREFFGTEDLASIVHKVRC